MSRFDSTIFHASPRQVFIGITALWLLILLGEGALVLDGRMRWCAAQRAFADKQHEADRLAALDPSPNAAQAARIEARLAYAKGVLAELMSKFADAPALPGKTGASAGDGVSRSRAQGGNEEIVRDLRDHARRAGVRLREGEQFGLGETRARGAGADGMQRSEAAALVVGALLEAHPVELIAVQFARPLLPNSRTKPSLPRAGKDAAVELFAFEERHSVSEPGLIETVPVRLTFTSRTATVRKFIQTLSSSNSPAVISEIAVEEASSIRFPQRRKSAAAGAVVLVLQPGLSRFAVTVEFCELAMDRVAPVGVSSGAGRPGDHSLSRCSWTEPVQQARGPGWIYELFAPPAVFRDRPGRALAAVPPGEAVLADPEYACVDLQLLRVRRKPFRLRLVGFAGRKDDLRGIFADSESGRTVVARAGDLLVDRRVQLTRLAFDAIVSSARGCRETAAVAIILDEATGEEIRLTPRGSSMAGAPFALFGSQKHPAWKREFHEGDSFALDGSRYRVGRIELEPALSVVTRVPSDGEMATSHALILRHQQGEQSNLSSVAPAGNSRSHLHQAK